MSSRARFWIITLVAFVFSCGVVLLTAYSVGADPLHPRSRHIWALSLIAAAYASIRVAMIIGRFLDSRDKDESETSTSFGLFRKKDHAIDRRMAERRARLDAAQKRDKETTSSIEDAGND